MSRHFGASPIRDDRKGILLAIGLVFVLICVLVAYIFLRPQNPEPAVVGGGEMNVAAGPAPMIKEVEVLVPKQNIDAGKALQPNMFRKERRPKYGLDNRVITDYEQIVGYFSRTLILQGQPLHMDFVSNIKPTTAISAEIPPGYRAVTIRVTATSSVEGWARPGSKVDVNWSSTIRGKPGVTVIVQNAKVLSAERNVSSETQPGAHIPATVTLLVTAQDAQKIQLAMTSGALSLTLRGDEDTGKSDVNGSITIDELFEGARPSKRDKTTQGMVTIGGKKWVVNDRGGLEPWGESE